MEILDSQQATPQQLRYAGFWIRVAAMIIDIIVIYGVIFVIGIFASGLFFAKAASSDFSDGPSESLIFGIIVAYGLIALGVIAYFTLMESSDKQATLGKMAVGIKVGKAHGEKLSFLNALGRHFSKILSGMILYIGYIMVGFDEKKQGLHDKIADTYVYYR